VVGAWSLFSLQRLLSRSRFAAQFEFRHRRYLGLLALQSLLFKPDAAKEAGDRQHEAEQRSQAELKSAWHGGSLTDPVRWASLDRVSLGAPLPARYRLSRDRRFRKLGTSTLQCRDGQPVPILDSLFARGHGRHSCRHGRSLCQTVLAVVACARLSECAVFHGWHCRRQASKWEPANLLDRNRCRSCLGSSLRDVVRGVVWDVNVARPEQATTGVHGGPCLGRAAFKIGTAGALVRCADQRPCCRPPPLAFCPQSKALRLIPAHPSATPNPLFPLALCPQCGLSDTSHLDRPLGMGRLF
jgi:hypothetical protein